MKQLLAMGNRYASESSWKDFALTKFCLAAMGIIIGTFIPKEKTKTVRLAAGGVFGATYVVLMKKVFLVIKEMRDEQ